MKNLIYILFFLLFQHLSAQTPRQVLDLIPATTSTFNDPEDELKIGVGNRALFVVYRQFKYELWSSDGSEAGTSMLMVGNNGEDYPEFLPYDSKQVLFVADRNNGRRIGSELWLTDGTAAGTRKLFSNASKQIRKVRVHQGQIFYVSASATEFFDQTELWRYNPTTSENQMLARYKGPDGIKDLVAFNDQLILLAQSKDSTYQLIKSDGTVAGTQAYHTLKNDGDLGGSPFLTATEKQVFFFFRYSKYDELYHTDGTAAGTLRLATYEPVITGEVARRERTIMGWNQLFFYSACPLGTSFCTYRDFFVSDGTVAGTKQLDFNERSNEDVSYLTPYRNKLFLHAGQPSGIATTDGSLAGTSFPIVDNRNNSTYYGGDYLCVVQDSLYYVGYRAGGGYELYRSDGSVAGTRYIDVLPGSSSSEPEQLTPAGNRLFFTANRSGNGRELWVYEALNTSTSSREAATLPAQIKLWPNPAAEQLEVQIQADQALKQITIFDVRQSSDASTTNIGFTFFHPYPDVTEAKAESAIVANKLAVKLSWEYVNDPFLNGFVVYRSENEGPLREYQILEAATFPPVAPVEQGRNYYAWRDTLVKVGVSYKYQIVAKFLDGSASKMSAAVTKSL